MLTCERAQQPLTVTQYRKRLTMPRAEPHSWTSYDLHAGSFAILSWHKRRRPATWSWAGASSAAKKNAKQVRFLCRLPIGGRHGRLCRSCTAYAQPTHGARHLLRGVFANIPPTYTRNGMQAGPIAPCGALDHQWPRHGPHRHQVEPNRRGDVNAGLTPAQIVSLMEDRSSSPTLEGPFIA